MNPKKVKTEINNNTRSNFNMFKVFENTPSIKPLIIMNRNVTKAGRIRKIKE